MLYCKRLVAVLFLLVAIPAAAYPKWIKQADQTVETPVGNFRLTKLESIVTLGLMSLKGELTNDSTKTWDDVWFAVELNDKNGPVVLKSRPRLMVLSADPKAAYALHARNIAPGQTFKIKVDLEDGVKADGDSLRMVFKYGYGLYPVTYKLALVKPVASDNLAFSDDAIAIVFVPSGTALNFILQNKGDAPVKLDWNMVSFVSPDGTAQGVIHNGVKLSDRTAPKAPSMVPPRARIEDSIIPVENIELVRTDWVTNPLLPTGPISLKMTGLEFSVFMPLDVGGTTKNYNFVFKITGVQ